MQSFPGDPITRRLVALGKLISHRFQAELAEHGCSISTWAVLNSTHRHPGLSQVQLAAAIGIEGPTLARHLDRLCAEGLVERRRDDVDRRVTRIELTAKGAERWEQLRSVAIAHEERVMHQFSDEERAELRDLIDRIHRALEDTYEHV